MNALKTGLQVVSSLLVLLGLELGIGIQLLIWMSEGPVPIVCGILLLTLITVIRTFQWFHREPGPPVVIAMVGTIEAIWAAVTLLACMGEVNRSQNGGPLAGVGAAIMIYVSILALLSAGLLIVGSMIAMVAGRMRDAER